MTGHQRQKGGGPKEGSVWKASRWLHRQRHPDQDSLDRKREIMSEISSHFLTTVLSLQSSYRPRKGLLRAWGTLRPCPSLADCAQVTDTSRVKLGSLRNISPTREAKPHSLRSCCGSWGAPNCGIQGLRPRPRMVSLSLSFLGRRGCECWGLSEWVGMNWVWIPCLLLARELLWETVFAWWRVSINDSSHFLWGQFCAAGT